MLKQISWYHLAQLQCSLHNYHNTVCAWLPVGVSDSVQTPGFPHGDGDCAPPGCDVGKALPIGAYIFNHSAANVSVNGQTFLQWYIDEYLFGPNGGSNPNISGFFFDGECYAGQANGLANATLYSDLPPCTVR